MTRVVLLIVGEDDRTPVPLRIEPPSNGRVTERRVTDRTDRSHDLVDTGEHRRAGKTLQPALCWP